MNKRINIYSQLAVIGMALVLAGLVGSELGYDSWRLLKRVTTATLCSFGLLLCWFWAGLGIKRLKTQLSLKIHIAARIGAGLAVIWLLVLAYFVLKIFVFPAGQ